MSIWLPKMADVLLLHTKLTARSGGSDGIREAGLIESALARASAAFGGMEAYPDAISKAAAAGCGLAQNHGFIDGNKRIGVMTMLLILRRNSIALSYTQAELTDVGMGIARGEMDVPDVLDWIKAHLS